MDVILTNSLVNYFLGIVYLTTAFSIGALIKLTYRSGPDSWGLVMSSKAYWLFFMWFVLFTCLTVSYQNFFGDYSAYLLWWRLFLISGISVVCWKWKIHAKRLLGSKKELDEEVASILDDEIL